MKEVFRCHSSRTFNENDGTVFCLCEAPSREAAEQVHREAHGLVADEVVEVSEGS
ncbi:MAG TPA: nickel-binding protein [Thermoanaerobaculia bacterium]|nr:nickel-binding protein [Thermoanaerobaculia bacterium]